MDVYIGIGGIMLVVFIGTYFLLKLALRGCDTACDCNCTGNCNQGRQCDCKNKS
jgi:hypothetical protein